MASPAVCFSLLVSCADGGGNDMQELQPALSALFPTATTIRAAQSPLLRNCAWVDFESREVATECLFAANEAAGKQCSDGQGYATVRLSGRSSGQMIRMRLAAPGVSSDENTAFRLLDMMSPAEFLLDGQPLCCCDSLSNVALVDEMKSRGFTPLSPSEILEALKRHLAGCDDPSRVAVKDSTGAAAVLRLPPHSAFQL